LLHILHSMKMYSSVWAAQNAARVHWNICRICMHVHGTHTHTHTRARAREHTYTNATAEHNINIRNRTLCTCTVAEISRIYDIRRLSSQSYAIKRRRALSSFRQSAGCASKLIMHPNRRDMRVKVSFPSLPPTPPLSLSLSLPLILHSFPFWRGNTRILVWYALRMLAPSLSLFFCEIRAHSSILDSKKGSPTWESNYYETTYIAMSSGNLTNVSLDELREKNLFENLSTITINFLR